jgi:hypothetical protein
LSVEQLLDGHAVPFEELDRAAQETDSCRRALVRQHLGVGEPGAVVDRDVNVFPADHFAIDTGGVDARAVRVALDRGDALPGAGVDPAELLHVDVDQLAGPLALVTLWRLEPDPAELAHPNPRQDP